MRDIARPKNSLKKQFEKIAPLVSKCQARILESACDLGPRVRGGHHQETVIKRIMKMYQKDYNDPRCAQKFRHSLTNLQKLGLIDLLDNRICMMPFGSQFYIFLKENNPKLFFSSESPV